ncbi:MAG: hypothetical protein ACTSVB_11780, partial [Candidatus Heimdallarchaeaceae archaeon]
GLNIYLKLSCIKKNANKGIIYTVPDILKIAKAWTLFVANVLTIKAENGAKSEYKIATGIYAIKSNCVFTNNPDVEGKINKSINAKSDIKNMRIARKLFLDMGITFRTVSKWSSLSSSNKNAAINPKIIGIKSENNMKKTGKNSGPANSNEFSILGDIRCTSILANMINIIG